MSDRAWKKNPGIWSYDPAGDGAAFATCKVLARMLNVTRRTVEELIPAATYLLALTDKTLPQLGEHLQLQPCTGSSYAGSVSKDVLGSVTTNYGVLYRASLRIGMGRSRPAAAGGW
jgi:hypothetical protein